MMTLGRISQAARRLAGERSIARLADGAFVFVRPLRPGDREPLRQAITSLSARTRHLRFHGAGPKPTEAELDYLLQLDGRDRAAWCAATLWPRVGLGVARYVRLSGETTVADIALTVVDGWQHRGIGRLLLDRLAGTAEAAGIEFFRAVVLAENRAVLEWFRSLGARETRLPDHQIEADIPVAACRRA